MSGSQEKALEPTYPPSIYDISVVSKLVIESCVLPMIRRACCSWYSLLRWVPVGSPSRGGNVMVYVLDLNQPSLPTLYFCSCVCFCLYGPFTCISFHKFSRQLSAFSLCCSGPISALLLVLNYISLFIKVSLSPDTIFSG